MLARRDLCRKVRQSFSLLACLTTFAKLASFLLRNIDYYRGVESDEVQRSEDYGSDLENAPSRWRKLYSRDANRNSIIMSSFARDSVEGGDFARPTYSSKNHVLPENQSVVVRKEHIFFLNDLQSTLIYYQRRGVAAASSNPSRGRPSSAPIEANVTKNKSKSYFNRSKITNAISDLSNTD